MESAFYERAGQDTYVATAATVGPWSVDAQHGGPPSALAAMVLERHEPDERQRLARVAIDILRPVPVAKISVRTRTLRPGRRVALLETVFEADGQEILHARGWRVQRSSGDVPEVTDGSGAPAPVPEEGDGSPPLIFAGEPRGYLAAIEWRFLADTGKSTASDEAPSIGPLRATWTRPRIPLLLGEESSPMSRVLLVADSGSGVSAAVPATSFIFINVDLTVILPRDPVGEWLLLEASTTIGATGTGLATTRLSDRLGACGTGIQTLFVAPR